MVEMGRLPLQSDMHFYAAFVLARAAGIPRSDAFTIAYASQFVDDSTKTDSEQHPDKGMLYGTATAHHDAEVVLNARFRGEYGDREQRRIWVPFHFLPGGEGINFEQRLICMRDSVIAREMMDHHIGLAVEKPYGLELLGIAAHVYMDSFAHYGFSGISSSYNRVDPDSIELIDIEDPAVERYILNKYGSFIKKYNLRNFIFFVVEKVTASLGHGSVATYPDRPFLHWRVEFLKKRPGTGQTLLDRNNRETFLEACEKLHGYFVDYAQRRYGARSGEGFAQISKEVLRILSFEGKKEERIRQWTEAIKNRSLYEAEPDEANTEYAHTLWEEEKNDFPKLGSSSEALAGHVYRFHQAAALHREYVLRDLLPSHGLCVN